jgi:hypothetical protein
MQEVRGVPSNVIELDKSQLDNTIRFVEDKYVSENGIARAEFHPIGNKVVFQSKGFQVVWLPISMKYIDEFGIEDDIYSVQDAPLEVKGNKARFDRSMPDVDDVFIVDGDRLKHTIVIQGWQREPAPYLSGNIDFVISGTLEFDPSLSVHSMGMQLVGPFESGESIEIRNGDELIFTLPKIVAYDSNIPERAEAFGRYRVTSNENGVLAFDIVMDNAWMADEARVYPVLIDPTVVVSSAYDTSGNGRKLVRLSNGWLVAGVYDSTRRWVIFYKSADNGTTWTQLCYSTRDTISWAITSKGTNVYVLISPTGTGNNAFHNFDATTVTNGALPIITNVDSGQSTFGSGASLAINDAGTELHGAWVSKNPTYPNSFNIRYAKGTIDGNGNVSWGSVLQRTTANTSGTDYINPYLIIVGTTPYVVVESSMSGSDKRIRIGRADLATAFTDIYSGGSYSQSNPCAVVDGNGVIHVVWHGVDATDNIQNNIRYSKSTDGGATWSAVTKLTTGNTCNNIRPTIARDLNNKLYVFFVRNDPAGSGSQKYRNIYLMTYDTSWSSLIQLTANTTNDCDNPSAMEKESGSQIGWVYQDFQASSVLFDSIILNQAPTAPTNLSPNSGGYDRATVIRLSWQHNDQNAGDIQSKFDLQWRKVGDTTWNSVTQVTTYQYWDAPANTFPKGQIEWRVRTYDQAGLVSPYSAQAVFTASDKPATPTITEPSAVITGPRPNVAWSSVDQASYQVQVLDGAATIWDSNEIISGNKSVTVGIDLTNGKTYTFKVRIKNADGIWSDWASISQLVSFTPPPAPSLTVTAATEKITIQITNPAPVDPQPPVAYNDLYRKKKNETVWTRIATNIPNNGTYDDYTPASGELYDYFVRAWGNTGSYADSSVQSGETSFTGVWLHCVDDPAGTIHRFALSSGNSDEWRTDGSLMKFAGRKRPAAVFGENEDGRITANLQMLRNRGDREALQNIVQRKTTVCYRDNRGRKMFGVIFQLPSNDVFYGYSVSVSIDEIDYKEEV